MIYIDIYVPDMDESFEFRCDENAPVSSVCGDVYEILLRKNSGTAESGSRIFSQFWLCDIEGQRILSFEKSLREEKIRNGSRLIFL